MTTLKYTADRWRGNHLSCNREYVVCDQVQAWSRLDQHGGWLEDGSGAPGWMHRTANGGFRLPHLSGQWPSSLCQIEFREWKSPARIVKWSPMLRLCLKQRSRLVRKFVLHGVSARFPQPSSVKLYQKESNRSFSQEKSMNSWALSGTLDEGWGNLRLAETSWKKNKLQLVYWLTFWAISLSKRVKRPFRWPPSWLYDKNIKTLEGRFQIFNGNERFVRTFRRTIIFSVSSEPTNDVWVVRRVVLTKSWIEDL